MAHSHDHASPSHGRAFGIGVALNVAYVALEAGYGFWANSLSLLADAGHNLGDVLGLLLAWGGYSLSRIRPTERHTYGWRSSTILAALFNALILLVAVGGIAWEAMRRLSEPIEPSGTTIVVVAGIGVFINTATALLFLRGRARDLNVRGAFLHMAADAGVSLGVVVAGLGIRWTGWAWIDPASSLVIAAVIFAGTWGLLRESVNLAMQAVPEGIDPSSVRDFLSGQVGVEDVHDLHIWAMSTTEVALTAHLVKPDPAGDDAFLARVAGGLHDRFGIEHATIQLERRPCGPCLLSGPGAG
ncbi:cation diffusion facilitator family transporter [Tautonia plasticadhaerens]|uniref:Cadmium, cobalt and zinc/H(+)-K(+) antiporter n=1 Tax=Tautonia plasticadhaerens TaxID=2527974 RepID=A0A518GZS5_9BACT|nr:cation diffusion facilitator family transporter [Tautonia plasticadhaerens]QDV34087.1 Cadmium, cobalt and zinc/H(+)-K(+) antiporter [Tautonia plasticadhaerens]